MLKPKYEQFNSSLSDVKQSIINLNVFYDRLSYTEITEKPSFPFVDLVSNVGGTFGLFIGISLLSLLEIVELIYEMLLIFSNKKIIPVNQSDQIQTVAPIGVYYWNYFKMFRFY